MIDFGIKHVGKDQYRIVSVQSYDVLGNPLEYSEYFTAEQIQRFQQLLQQTQPQEPQSENVEEVIIDEL